MTFNVPYDGDSIMHYYPTSFAKKSGLYTILAKVCHIVTDNSLIPMDVS